MAKSRKSRASRRARDRPERKQDPRLVAVQVTGESQGEIDVRPGDWLVAVSPVALADGRVLAFHPPQPVTFNLVEAKTHADRGVRRRRAILGNLTGPGTDGAYRPTNPRAAIDCLSDLVSAVLHSFAAIESLANHSIEQLPEEATVDVTRQSEAVAIPRAEMVRRLNITEKLTLAVPLLEDGVFTKGTVAWERFVHLKRLRDELVHIKERGYSTDPEAPSAYGRLMRGDGDGCVEDAIALVMACRPVFLPDHVLDALRVGAR